MLLDFDIYSITSNRKSVYAFAVQRLKARAGNLLFTEQMYWPLMHRGHHLRTPHIRITKKYIQTLTNVSKTCLFSVFSKWHSFSPHASSDLTQRPFSPHWSLGYPLLLVLLVRLIFLLPTQRLQSQNDELDRLFLSALCWLQREADRLIFPDPTTSYPTFNVLFTEREVEWISWFLRG